MLLGGKRDIEDRIIPRSLDADDSDVDVKSDDERFLSWLSVLWILIILVFYPFLFILIRESLSFSGFLQFKSLVKDLLIYFVVGFSIEVHNVFW